MSDPMDDYLEGVGAEPKTRPIPPEIQDIRAEARGAMRELEARAAQLAREDSERDAKIPEWESTDRATVQSVKESNPKDAIGVKKVPYSVIPAPVMAEVGVALFEGACKYGRHNYRAIGVRASVYYDAAVARHLAAWWEGEDIDPDSDLSHITKAIAGLVVLRDAMIQGKWVDDRPPPSPSGWLERLNAKIVALAKKYPNPVPPYTSESVVTNPPKSRG